MPLVKRENAVDLSSRAPRLTPQAMGRRRRCTRLFSRRSAMLPERKLLRSDAAREARKCSGFEQQGASLNAAGDGAATTLHSSFQPAKCDASRAETAPI